MPQGQRAFITQPVNQMTRPRWQSQQVRQMGSSGGPYTHQVGPMRANAGGGNMRPRHQGPNIARRDAPYQPGMTGRNMQQNQQMQLRPAGPAAPPQRAAYKYTANIRNQFSAQQVMPSGPPEQAPVVLQVNKVSFAVKYFHVSWLPRSLKVLECPGIFSLSWNVLEFLGLSPFVLEMSWNFSMIALSNIYILY